MRRNIAIYLKAIIIAIALLTAYNLHAQNSKQETELYSLYKDALKKINSKECIDIANYIRKKAVAEGNRDMELLALTIPMKYEYMKPDNIAKLEKTLKPLMDLALKYNKVEAFYNAVSYKVTYLTNYAYYSEALKYQDNMLKFAKQHGHSYGIIIGHISLGNMHRKQLQIVQAIDEYNQAIDCYKKYNIKHDIGIDYKRIAECYIIVWHFQDAIKTINKGLEESEYIPAIKGLWGYKAFTLFMLEKDDEFKKAYDKFISYKNTAPNIMPFIANCLEVMKLINDGKNPEAEKKMQQTEMGAFRLFVDIAYNKRKGRLPQMFSSMQKLNTSLYGDSKKTFIADWARMSAEISNNLSELDKQRAANKLSELEIEQTNLKIKNNDLELSHLKNEEALALANTESKRISYMNQRLLAQRLSNSLVHQQMARKAQEKEAQSLRIRYIVILAIIAIISILAYLYLQRSNKLTQKLQHTRKCLTDTLVNLNIANDKAQEADRMKTRFVQNMSHEIRTPLNSIVGFSQILSENSDYMTAEEREEMTKMITTNSEILTTLINDILDLTSIESGKYVMKSEEVNIYDACKQAINDTIHRKADAVELVCDIKIPKSFTILSDKRRLIQVTENMLTNAMKYTEAGSITLECSTDDLNNILKITVTDTGIGIPKDKHLTIFERFSKLDKYKQGAGLGLYICKVIAEKLGGKIEINADYTNGARFEFSIPIKR